MVIEDLTINHCFLAVFGLVNTFAELSSVVHGVLVQHCLYGTTRDVAHGVYEADASVQTFHSQSDGRCTGPHL